MEESKILTCIQCGTCHSSCPSGRYTSLNIRKIVKEPNKSDIPELWMCATCYNCQERCPRGIKITDMVFYLRNKSAKSGNILLSHKKVCEFLINTGHAVPIDKEHLKIRKEIGLKPSETIQNHPESLKEIKTLLESTKFTKMIL